jgi:tRNA/rRNA methyltransferase
MSNFGFLNLRVVNPYEVAFREARSAAGAHEVMARAEEYKTVADAIADCTLVVGTTAVGNRDLLHPLHGLATGAGMIRAELRRSNVALLFGTEKFGLSNEDLSHCHWVQRIPTREAHGSMNLGQAVAVCAYELARGNEAVEELISPEQRSTASAGKLELITNVLAEILRESGYVKTVASETADEKIRRLVRRLNLSIEDADVWLGMLRQIAWKLRQGPDRN